MKLKLTILLAIFSLHAFAQKEVYFADTSTVNKKVQSLQGFELNAIPNILDNDLKYVFGDHFNISGYVGYFYEMPIAKTWSIIYTAGIHNVYFNNIVFIDEYTYSYKKDYKVIPHIGIEPRWYYTFNKRFEEGKTNLNSGWFLGCPVSLEYPFSALQIHINPSIGFRQSLTNHIFLEAEAGIGSSLYLKFLPRTPDLDYFLSAKIAYSF
jgi:hypothetical protein